MTLKAGYNTGMKELTGGEPEVPKFAANDDGFAEGAAFTRSQKEGSRILGEMQEGVGIDPLADANDNMSLLIGDWVRIKDEVIQQLISDHLESRPPFILARIEGDLAYIVPRSVYKPGMHVPITPMEMKAKTVPSWGIPISSLKLEIKPSIVK